MTTTTGRPVAVRPPDTRPVAVRPPDTRPVAGAAVPRITRLAQDLLTAEPNPAEMERLKVRSIEADAVAATP